MATPVPKLVLPTGSIMTVTPNLSGSLLLTQAQMKTNLLIEAGTETARRLRGQNDNRGIIVRVENELKVIRPPRVGEENNQRTKMNNQDKVVQKKCCPGTTQEFEYAHGVINVLKGDAQKAGDQGFEWVSFKINANAIVNQRRNSAIPALPEGILTDAFRISSEEARRLKYNREENQRELFAPRSEFQGREFESA
ncbi:hypothetical protein FRX31_034765 [Thalictrum thalictroides]|uniref:Uncharacterized protein n=1 Tax=Thalictrum thalictroides TaxID=46969 RepID=A0A7J6USY2_THATH|nr:hypothetical protein FRX31_034765 [Thalictrum thalictroides]